jgi:chemotaxis protein methyltransferase CheR
MTSASWANASFEAVANLVRRHMGHSFPPSRRRDIESGIRKIMAKAGIADVGQCLSRLRDEASLLEDLIDELTVGETYFFRDPGHFSHIRDEVVPSIRRLRGADHILRVWSAGCATGEEAYSLAIVFDDLGLANRTRILATDISQEALNRARKGVYGAWSLRGSGASLAGRHLRRRGAHFHLAERIRRMVQFKHLNLAQDAYPAAATNTLAMDLVLCRNVLIYLDAETVRAVAGRLHASLAPGGVLIAGPSDPLLSEFAPFEISTTACGIVYRKRHAPGEQPPLPLAERVAWRGGAPAAMPTSARIETVAERPRLPSAPDRVAKTIDPLAEALAAFARGDNGRAVELTESRPADVAATALCLRALANLGTVEAAAARAAEALSRHPASVEVNFLHAAFLMDLGRYADAERALKRVLYLDRTLAVAQFALGATLRRLGNIAGAARAYRNAHDLAAGRSPAEELALSDGQTAGQLALSAAALAEALERPAGRVQ